MNLSTNGNVMTNPPPRKFMFTRSFENGSDGMDEAKAPVFTEEQMAAARQEGYDEGYSAGQSSTQEEQQAQFNALIQEILESLLSVTQELARRTNERQQGITEVSAAILSKTLPDALHTHALNEVQALARKVVSELSHEPRFVMRVVPDMVAPLEELMKGLSDHLAFQGQILVIADETLGASDCKIEWSDGGIDRNMERFWSELDEVTFRITGQNPNTQNIMAGVGSEPIISTDDTTQE